MRTQLLDSSDGTFTDSFVFLSEEMARELLKISGLEKGGLVSLRSTQRCRKKNRFGAGRSDF